MQEFVTHSREETVAVGRELAKTLPAGALIAFTGGLGAGKTAFCQGLAEGLGCTDPVSSPTFAIVNYYRGPKPLAHFDLYRISTENDLCAAGFYMYAAISWTSTRRTCTSPPVWNTGTMRLIRWPPSTC